MPNISSKLLTCGISLTVSNTSYEAGIIIFYSHVIIKVVNSERSSDRAKFVESDGGKVRILTPNSNPKPWATPPIQY